MAKSKSVMLDLAASMDKAFPEFDGRIVPVSEVEVDKSNVPQLPIVFLALVTSPIDHVERGNKPPTITENFVVEFWFPSNKYLRKDGTESPFWAYYDYEGLRDKFIAFTMNYRSPRKALLKFTAMEIESTPLAVMISFTLRHQFDWCAPDEILKELDLYEDVPLEIFSKIEFAMECCSELPCTEEEKPKCP